MITDQEQLIIAKAVHDLGEFFSEVQILVSRISPEGTERYFLGEGNWFARKGMAQSFLDNDNQLESARKIANELHPPQS